MNFRLILNIMGYTLWVEAGCLLLPLLVSAGYGEACWEPFLWTLGLCSLCGLILTRIPARKNRLQGRDGYTVVAMAWIVLCLFGAVPYVLSGAVPHYADALFETASGLTTTGATILTDVEAMPRGILFWRALTQWMGGMGVLVLFLALMPRTGAGAVHLMRAESPGPIKSKLLPHVSDTAKVLYGIYIGLTAAEIVALCLAGMDFYEAVLHSFSTISTGGFSTRNASIAAFGSPAITWIVAIFMFLSGINFSLIFISLRGHIRAALHSEELRLYTLLTLGSIGLIAASLMVQQSVPLGRALKDSVFNAVSTVTTTGFATADFAQWPVFGQMLLVILMFTGACAGSTSGGIKVSRILLLGKLLPQLSPSTFNTIINVLFLVLGFVMLNRGFGARTVYCSILSAGLIQLFEWAFPMDRPLTDQLMLELFFAVILPALGSAILFNIDASSGGTDIAAMILKKYTGLDVGRALLLSDVVIAAAALFVFDITAGLCSLLGLALKSVLVDSAIESFNRRKAFFVISYDPEHVCDYITHTLGRGATVWQAQGAYTHAEHHVVLTVLTRGQAVLLRRYLKKIDPHAFLIVANSSEIFGKGFLQP